MEVATAATATTARIAPNLPCISCSLRVTLTEGSRHRNPLRSAQHDDSAICPAAYSSVDDTGLIRAHQQTQSMVRRRCAVFLGRTVAANAQVSARLTFRCESSAGARRMILTLAPAQHVAAKPPVAPRGSHKHSRLHSTFIANHNLS